jgi:alpha-galactosidase
MHLDHLRESAEMWRVSDDLWDRWSDVLDQFSRMARWAPFQQAGSWADADMLPLGRIGIRAERGEDRDSLLTLDEQRTLMSLWMMSRSPLMYGGDLPRSRPETIALLTVPGMIRVLQHSQDNREVIREDDLVVWTAAATDADARYVAVFQLGAEGTVRRIPLSSVGLRPGAPTTVTDVWSGEPVSVGGDALELDVPAHGARVVRFDLG